MHSIVASENHVTEAELIAMVDDAVTDVVAEAYWNAMVAIAAAPADAAPVDWNAPIAAITAAAITAATTTVAAVAPAAAVAAVDWTALIAAIVTDAAAHWEAMIANIDADIAAEVADPAAPAA